MKQLPLLLAAVFLASAAGTSCVTNANSQNNKTDETGAVAVPPDEALPSGKLIDWKALSDNAWIHRNGNGEVYVYIDVTSGEVKQEKKRVPLNISLVLDRSGSMSGDKIAYAKKATKFVIDQLGSEDMVSIVNYDDRVEVLSPSQKVKNKEALKYAVDRLYDRGTTNLTGGMLEGYAQVQATKREGYVNRVLLLTDGLANAGITEPGQMKRLVEKKYREQGVALSTFGLGADYNEDLLTLLAETGHANYYYIDQADKIPQIFAGELKGLLSVVAQNAMVSVTIPEGMSCEKVYGYPYEVSNGSVNVRFNDIYANDRKAVLLKFRTTGSRSGAYSFNCRFRYTDGQSFNLVSEDKTVRVSSTPDAALVEQNRDAKVQEMIALFETTEMFEDIMKDADEGNYEAAKAKAAGTVTMLKEKQKVYKSDKLRLQEQQISAYAASMDSMASMPAEEKSRYQKSNKEVNYKTRKMK